MTNIIEILEKNNVSFERRLGEDNKLYIKFRMYEGEVETYGETEQDLNKAIIELALAHFMVEIKEANRSWEIDLDNENQELARYHVWDHFS